MNWLQDGLEQRLSESWNGFKRRTVEEAHAIGVMLVEAHQTADLREGGFRGVLRRSGIPHSTGYQLVELVSRYPEVSSVDTYPTVAAALQAPSDEEPEQPELSEAPAEPTAVPPEPESLSQERRLAEQAPTANDIDPAIRARMDACLDDLSRSDADLRQMRGNLLNVIDGMLAPLLFLERWERASAAPVVVTPLPDDPEPPTEQAVVARRSPSPRLANSWSASRRSWRKRNAKRSCSCSTKRISSSRSRRSQTNSSSSLARHRKWAAVPHGQRCASSKQSRAHFNRA